MKRKLVLATVFLTLLLVLTVSLTTSAYAATRPTHSSSSDFYTLEKTCTVINVYLHGTQSPTTTCAQAKLASGVSPNTEVKPCSVPGVTMVIQYNNATQDVCFIQTGYWGYRVNAVTAVYSPRNGSGGTGVNGWFLWYYRGYTTGHVCNINANNYWSASFVGRLTTDITQIDPGAQHSGAVSC